MSVTETTIGPCQNRAIRSVRNETVDFLFLLNVPDGETWGGCENHMMRMIERLSPRWRCGVAVTQEAFAREFERREKRLRVLRLPKEACRGLRAFFVMRRFLKRNPSKRIVFVHNHFAMFDLWSYLAAASSRCRIFALHVLETPEPAHIKVKADRWFNVMPRTQLWRWAQRLRFQIPGLLVERVCVVAEELKQQLAVWYGYPEDKITVTLHGRCFPLLPIREAYETTRLRLDVAKDSIVILTHGRLSVQKDLPLGLQAFEAAASKNPHLIWWVVGEGPMKEFLMNAVERSSVKDRIRFWGFQNDVASFLTAADIYFSTSCGEGLSGGLVEAMSMGLYCVVTRVCGVQETLGRYPSGRIVEKRCVEDLAQALLEAVPEIVWPKRQIRINTAATAVRRMFDPERTWEIKRQALGLVDDEDQQSVNNI